jgi:hypothetical protein
MASKKNGGNTHIIIDAWGVKGKIQSIWQYLYCIRACPQGPTRRVPVRSLDVAHRVVKSMSARIGDGRWKQHEKWFQGWWWKVVLVLHSNVKMSEWNCCDISHHVNVYSITDILDVRRLNNVWSNIARVQGRLMVSANNTQLGNTRKESSVLESDCLKMLGKTIWPRISTRKISDV